jgi:hypothetical protein
MSEIDKGTIANQILQSTLTKQTESALTTALLGSTNSQERWVNSRGVQQQLEAEKFLFQQRAGRYATSNEEQNIRMFSERLVEIWSDARLAMHDHGRHVNPGGRPQGSPLRTLD